MKLRPEQVDTVADVVRDAWMDPELPRLQYDAVKPELEAFAKGEPCAPFDAIVKLLRGVDGLEDATLLDVGAASGYYSEVFKNAGFTFQYTALDCSTYYSDLAQEIYPDVQFKLGNALEIPFESRLFDIVLHGGCLLHLRNYPRAIREAARVSKKYVVFHRIPVYTDDTPTTFFMKTAYGVPCIEAAFSAEELRKLFLDSGLKLINSLDIFTDGNFAHRTHLFSV